MQQGILSGILSFASGASAAKSGIPHHRIGVSMAQARDKRHDPFIRRIAILLTRAYRASPARKPLCELVYLMLHSYSLAVEGPDESICKRSTRACEKNCASMK
jgi:hypothetical protein